LSPGKIRMKCIRIFPEIWANTLWPLSSSTRNIAFGKGSMTVPSISMTSCFAMGSTDLLFLCHEFCQRRPDTGVRHLFPGIELSRDFLVDCIVNPQVANVFSLRLGNRPPIAISDVDERPLPDSE